VDEVLAGFSVGIGDELVVGKVEAEDVGVNDEDGARGGGVADGVGVEPVEGRFFALGETGVDCALASLVWCMDDTGKAIVLRCTRCGLSPSRRGKT